MLKRFSNGEGGGTGNEALILREGKGLAGRKEVVRVVTAIMMMMKMDLH